MCSSLSSSTNFYFCSQLLQIRSHVEGRQVSVTCFASKVSEKLHKVTSGKTQLSDLSDII